MVCVHIVVYCGQQVVDVLTLLQFTTYFVIKMNVLPKPTIDWYVHVALQNLDTCGRNTTIMIHQLSSRLKGTLMLFHNVHY